MHLYAPSRRTRALPYSLALLVALASTSPARAQAPCLAMSESPLAGLLGSWTVEWHYRTAPGEFAVSEARSDIVADLDGCALRERFSGTLRDTPYSSVTMISRPDDDRYDRMRIDSEHGAFTHSSGSVAGDSVVFTWQRDLGTRLLRTRHVVFAVRDASFEVAFYMSPREGAAWQLVERFAYRGAAPAAGGREP